MNKNCDICAILENPTHRILETKYWSAGVGNNQAYFGRAYVSLREHKASLSMLSRSEWEDFEDIVKKLEAAYKELFGAQPLNWGCFMNNAFRGDGSNPHVHWHIFPRYKTAPIFNNATYDDPVYGEHYDSNAERLVDDNTAELIAAKLSNYLNKKSLEL